MKRKESLLLFIVLLIAVISCTNSNPNKTRRSGGKAELNPFIEKYQGGYLIEVQGTSTSEDLQFYLLSKNGTARWTSMRVQRNGQTSIISEMSGDWNATENTITVTLNDKKGDTTTVYTIIGDKFFSSDHTRSLKKTP
jgi:hypothetical protein